MYSSLFIILPFDDAVPRRRPLAAQASAGLRPSGGEVDAQCAELHTAVAPALPDGVPGDVRADELQYGQAPIALAQQFYSFTSHVSGLFRSRSSGH